MIFGKKKDKNNKGIESFIILIINNIFNEKVLKYSLLSFRRIHNIFNKILWLIEEDK